MKQEYKERIKEVNLNEEKVYIARLSSPNLLSMPEEESDRYDSGIQEILNSLKGISVQILLLNRTLLEEDLKTHFDSIRSRKREYLEYKKYLLQKVCSNKYMCKETYIVVKGNGIKESVLKDKFLNVIERMSQLNIKIEVLDQQSVVSLFQHVLK